MKLCVCGKPLKWVADPTSYGMIGCGDLRCVYCCRTSGLCVSQSEAIREFDRHYSISMQDGKAQYEK